MSCRKVTEEKTVTVAGEILTSEELLIKLEDLLGEQQHREEEEKNEERDYYYDEMDFVATSCSLEEQWHCPPELMSNRVLVQMIDLLKELIKNLEMGE